MWKKKKSREKLEANEKMKRIERKEEETGIKDSEKTHLLKKKSCYSTYK